MNPLFTGDTRRQRKINLGGVSSAASHDAVLQQARAERSERQALRRRHDAAVQLQAWWRGRIVVQRAREDMRRRFDEDVSSIVAMRCLVLMGRDEERLERWSRTVADKGEASIFALADAERQSWLVLVQRVAVLLLQSVADAPTHERSVAHLQVLNALLDPSAIERTNQRDGLVTCQVITLYLLQHDYFAQAAKALDSIPIEAKSTSPVLPLLTPLLTAPLNIFSSNSETYQQCVVQIFQHVLSVALLPYRLPAPSLTRLSARLPLSSIDVLERDIEGFTASFTELGRVHLIANLLLFMPPRYSKLPTSSLSTYLKLLLSLLDTFFPRAFVAAPALQPDGPWTQLLEVSDSDDDENSTELIPNRRPSSSKTAERLQIDTRTRTRLQTLMSKDHLKTLLQITGKHSSTRPQFFALVLSVCRVWPTQSDNVLALVMSVTNAGLLRELYRSYVRSSPLGQTDDPRVLMDPANATHWPPLLFLVSEYNRMLVTMGDDEFFASSHGSSTNIASAHRNPLSLDELTSCSRQLMNIAFPLYWSENSPEVQASRVSGLATTWGWVRDQVTRCLQLIHARDSRRRFTPDGHWLCTLNMDIDLFIQAALNEEENIPLASLSRASSKRLAEVSPRLGVLHNIPFAIPFETRVSIFRMFIARDRNAYRRNEVMDLLGFGLGRRRNVTIRRGNVSQDGFDKLGNVNLKEDVAITFIDQFGQPEAGIDGGGVFKEFFTSLGREVFHADRGLWVATKNNELYPSPYAYAKESYSLEWYRFIGRILGKAMYNGILIDVAFAGFFLAKWLKTHSYLDDLASLDPELYKGLLFLKHYDGNLEDLSLNFTVTDQEFDVAKTIELVPNGSNIPVTPENRLQYITLVCYHRMTAQIRPQSDAFFNGLSEMIDPKWLRMFNQQELQILIGGVNTEIDLDDLRKNTNYGGLYDDNEPTIKTFWEIVDGFNHEQRRALLRFVTSCSRPPLLGFKELSPLFSIRDAGGDENRLPTASTCVNLLKLPRYRSASTLRAKLLQAIHSGAGFDLS